PGKALDTSLFWVVNRRNFATSILTKKRIPLPGLWSLVLAPILALKASRHALSHNSQVRIELCRRFDHRFDAFWEKLRKQSNALLAVRDLEPLASDFVASLRRDALW